MKPSTKEFESALKALETALAEKKTDIVRDASIQRFGFCVELSWKTAKRVMGSNSSAPRELLREMAAQGLISDPESWFEFLEARNLSSHTYHEPLAERVYAVAKKFLPEGKNLLQKLKCL